MQNQSHFREKQRKCWKCELALAKAGHMDHIISAEGLVTNRSREQAQQHTHTDLEHVHIAGGFLCNLTSKRLLLGFCG